MRKTLLFLLVALLMPALSWAQSNQAIQKAARTSATITSDTRTYIDPSVLKPVVQGEADSYSIGAWVKVINMLTMSGNPTPSNNMVIMGYGGRVHENDNGCWNLCATTTGELSIMGWGAQGASGTVGSKNLITGEWVHLMVVYDSEAPSLSVYMNGELLETKAMTGKHEWFTSEEPAFYFAAYGFNEALDEVQIYNKALTADEVAQAKVTAAAVSGLVGLYTFDEVAAGTTGQFDNKSTQDCASSQKMIHEAVSTSSGNAWSNGLANLTSKVESAPTLIEGREIPATEVTVTVTDGEGGTLSLTDGENTYTAGEHQILTGTELTVTATPEDGYDLVKITVTNGSAVTELTNGGKFVVAANASVTATYSSQLYTLTVNSAEGIDYTIKRSGVEVTDFTKMIGGEEYTLELTVPDSKKVTAVTLGDQALTATGGVYTFTMSADATLEIAAEDKATYTVTFDPCEGGTVSATRMVDGVERNVDSGETVTEGTVLTLSATPGDGYSFANYVVNGTNTSDATVTVNSDVTISAVFEEGIEYCIPQSSSTRGGSTTSSGGRPVNTITVSDGTNSITLQGGGSTANRPVYMDRTTQTLVSGPGKTVTLTVAASGEWMNTYIYADYDRNGFTVSDKVYSNFTGGHTNIAGTYSFTIPTDVTPGNVRIRYLLDWENIDPCVYGYGQNTDNGEAIIDFLINIPKQTLDEPRTVTVESADENLGTVAIVNPATDEKSISTDQKAVAVRATPAEGAAFLNWTDADGNVVSTSADYTYEGTTDATLTANFGYVVTYTVGEGGIATVTDADGMYITSGTVVAPGTEITVNATANANWKLLAITVNGERTTDNPATITVNAATEIGVTFTDAAYALTINVTGNGSVRVADDFDDAPAGTEYYNGDALALGTELYVFFIPEAGYKLESATVTGNADGDLTFPEDPEGLFELYNDTDYLVYVSSDGDLVINATFASSTVGIDGITADDENAPVEYYNLQGVRVNAENLSTGFYIRRQGSKTAKVFVTK